jgi:amino acid adenylation domain-containing protein
MSDRHTSLLSDLPREQQAIRSRCFHPSGSFIEFKKEDVEQSIPDRFEQVVCRYPERIAVKMENHVLTYSELNAAANRVGRAILKQQGDQAEPVGLLFEKGAPLMVSMLGVLKAGKFFVLLDPSFPKARITAVLESSQVGLMIFDRQNISLAKELGGSVSQITEFESIDPGIPTEELRLTIEPKTLALIVHTSGSTGDPKGVVHNHRNILHDIMLRTNAYHICAEDRLSLLASGTSSAINNTFLALLNGAALLPFDTRKEGATRLASWLSEESISVCWISSPLFRNLSAALTGNERFPDLRLIRLASDTVYKTDVDIYKKYFSPNCFLANGIAPTETGLLRTYVMDSEAEITRGDVPLGYALEDKHLLLLDETGKEVGFNEVGEIAVRSSYLSQGYWREPDLTERKFIPDPKDREERIYLTGDLGLMLPDGCLIYKGRKDFRVKVRGYGVEIIEVEGALRAHPAIKEAVVTTRQDKFGATLVAYFTACSQPYPSVSGLRSFLTERLPEYMVPSVFVMLDGMPQTPNGKIDRSALPVPDHFRPELDSRFVAPRTAVELQLAKIWAEVLEVNQVGIHDNFFDLGGDSLSATRILSRVQTFLNFDFPPNTLFEKSTIAALAESIEVKAK